MNVFDSTLATLERSLDLRLERHGLLASNMANLDTPNFTPADMDVSGALAETAAGESLAVTQPGHIGAGPGEVPGEPEIERRPDSAPGLDGNSVDLDRQLARIAENSLAYTASLRLVQKKMALLQYAITQGGGV